MCMTICLFLFVCFRVYEHICACVYVCMCACCGWLQSMCVCMCMCVCEEEIRPSTIFLKGTFHCVTMFWWCLCDLQSFMLLKEP